MESKTTDQEKCPICLETIMEMAIIDGCYHQFCFGCLYQWTFIMKHNRCPFCRNHIDTIRFNIRSKWSYDCLEVEHLFQRHPSFFRLHQFH
uniref:RING-type E3 ubiquitin transferase n=1 Tax=Dermatophagoides pteronyssinus TaxID=6956 RepID=A0A6P6Y9F3_DERPT|nr:E3 ubiquitin ligase rnf-5-like [Dermatophagoides pteronyssinus]